MRTILLIFLMLAGMGWGYNALSGDGGVSASSVSNAIAGSADYSMCPEIFIAASDAQEWEKNIADYTCDGTADEVQINTAIALAKEIILGSTELWVIKVQLSSGIFHLADSVIIYQDKDSGDNVLVSLIGMGLNKTNLRLINGADCHIIDASIPASGDTDIGFLEIRDMTLWGNYANNTIGHGIYTNIGAAATGSYFDGNFVRVMSIQIPEDGFHIEDCWGYKITDCITEYSKKAGLVITSTAGQTDISKWGAMIEVEVRPNGSIRFIRLPEAY